MHLSLRGRLLIGLLPSLALLLAGGCGWLYWYQKEMLLAEFDSKLARNVFEQFREIGRHIQRDQVVSADMTDGILLVDEWDTQTQQRLWGVVDGIEPVEAILAPLPTREGPGYASAELPDGRPVRVMTMWAPWSRRPRRSERRGERRGERPPQMRNEGRPRPAPPADGDRSPEAGPPKPNKTPRSMPTTGPANAAGVPQSQPAGPGRNRQREPRPPRPPRRVIQVVADLTPLHAALHRWLLMLAFTAAAGEVLVVAIVLLAVRRGLRPLKPLARDLAAIDDATLAQRVQTRSIPKEILPVVEQLNGLLERIEAAFTREQAFIANAAHELRTPLAGMLTQLEVTLRHDRPADEYHRAVSGILDVATSLHRMLDVLLTLSRLDAGQVQPAREPTDIPTLLRNCWRQAAPTAEARGLDVAWDLPASLHVETDRVLVERIVTNLLHNATEYADNGEPIRIAVTFADGMLRLSVRNAVEGLTPDEARNVFDRFWRKDAARSDAARHAGLGLALVQQCVRVLGGQASVAVDEGQFVATVELPVVEAQAPKVD